MKTRLSFQQAAGLDRSTARRWFTSIVTAMQTYQIILPPDQAMFIAQTGTESRGFTALSENLNYSAERLLTVFGPHRITPQQALLYGRDGGQPARQEAIANCIYGGFWGKKHLGNTEPGDGWRYRGRGLIQITGRENYQRCGDALMLDLLSEPDLLLQDGLAALSAAWFYVAKGCLDYSGEVEAITRIISGGQHGLNTRKQRYENAFRVFSHPGPGIV
ncbi:glycoside hydrolase family 19 protein [Klebsiella aerogenes]|nr:glycoside hydrolase family 19 protein [Klebsiella aerogenes]ELY3087844.1 glycoside hydrolase family 19 protein [Klebsiella aerogenes]